MQGFALVFAQVVLGSTFAWSSGQKLRDVAKFKEGLRALGIPNQLADGGAVPLVGLEVVASCLMLLPWVPVRAGLVLSAALLIVFSVALIRVIESGVIVGCHCFGSHETPISWFDVARNTGLLALVLVGWISLTNFSGTAPPSLLQGAISSIRSGDPTILIVTMVAVAFAVLWAHLPEIGALATNERRLKT